MSLEQELEVVDNSRASSPLEAILALFAFRHDFLVRIRGRRAGYLLPGWLVGLLVQPLIGWVAAHHNHFLVMLRLRSPCIAHELHVPCCSAVAEAEAGTEVPAGLRRGVGGSMNGSGGGGGSDLSLAPGPGPGAAQGPRRRMGAARGS